MELSENQIKVLKALQDDPRTSMRSLAEKADVSTPTASNIVDELEKMGIVKGYRTVLDTGKLGLYTFHITMEVDVHSTEEIVEKIVDMEEINELFELDGSDMFAKVIVSSLDELDDITRDLKGIQGVIRLNVSRETNCLKDSSTIRLETVYNLDIDCYYCKKTIQGTPVKLDMDGRKHYLCCETCASEYKEKYQKLKEKAESKD
ncbi:MAG: winged helix-turn-helix transcriptional regulator [Thermoplasmatota archaeon]